MHDGVFFFLLYITSDYMHSSLSFLSLFILYLPCLSFFIILLICYLSHVVVQLYDHSGE